MGLKGILREIVLIDDVASLLGIDLWNDKYQEGNGHELRERDMSNLRLAQMFVDFNPNRGYLLGTNAPKSKLYSPDEIAKVLMDNGYASDVKQGGAKAQELIDKGHIGFYWASRRAAGVRIVPYKNKEGDTKYRFEVNFCDDGL